MRSLGVLACVGFLVFGTPARAEEVSQKEEGQRVDSRYCTVWLSPGVSLDGVNRRVSVWRIRPRASIRQPQDSSQQFAVKCDTLFERVEDLLDMYPPGIHVSVRILPNQEEVGRVHQAHYGHETRAEAIYLFENNTIYASFPDLSEAVFGHEMAHAIIDHYFNVRPPRKIEEMLAIYAEENLRE